MYDLAAEGITTEREFVIRIANGLRPPLTDACPPEWRTLIEVCPCWCVGGGIRLAFLSFCSGRIGVTQHPCFFWILVWLSTQACWAGIPDARPSWREAILSLDPTAVPESTEGGGGAGAGAGADDGHGSGHGAGSDGSGGPSSVLQNAGAAVDEDNGGGVSPGGEAP